jgi:DNA-binding transcriptional regulator GbsR (MarR family)
MSPDNYKNKSDFVDEFSLKIEELGHPRIYGQILGWLLICDPPHQSFSDLIENLDISKASISNTTRMLIERGLIEKVRIKGERQIYFKLKDGSVIDFMQKQLKLALDLEEITTKGLKLIEKEADTDPQRLKKANDFHRFLAEQTKDLIQNYKAENNT